MSLNRSLEPSYLRVFLRFASVLLVASAMLFSSLVLPPVPHALARPIAPAPVSAPPEPFLLNSSHFDWSSTIATAVATLPEIRNPFAAPTLPDGFVPAAKPSVTERLSRAAISVFGVFTTISAKSNARSSAGSGPMPSAPISNITYDFDGDGRADIGRWHGSTYEFKIKNSNGGSSTIYNLGSSATAKPVPGDFNGDGKTDPAVFNNGTWTFKLSPAPSSTPQTISCGTTSSVEYPHSSIGSCETAVFRWVAPGEWQ